MTMAPSKSYTNMLWLSRQHIFDGDCSRRILLRKVRNAHHLPSLNSYPTHLAIPFICQTKYRVDSKRYPNCGNITICHIFSIEVGASGKMTTFYNIGRALYAHIHTHSPFLKISIFIGSPFINGKAICGSVILHIKVHTFVLMEKKCLNRRSTSHRPHRLNGPGICGIKLKHHYRLKRARVCEWHRETEGEREKIYK